MLFNYQIKRNFRKLHHSNTIKLFYKVFYKPHIPFIHKSIFIIFFISQVLAFSRDLPDSISNKVQNLSPIQKVNYYTELSWNLREKDTESAIKYGKIAIHLADSLKLIKEYGRASNFVGAINIHYLYNNSAAIPYFHKALEAALLTNDSTSIGYVYNNLGDAYYLTGNSALALDYANLSMKIFQSINDSIGIAYCHINFGLVNRFEKQFDLALEHFYKALEVRIKVNNAIGIASAYYEIALTHFYNEEFETALNFFQKSLKLNQELDNKRWMAFNYNGLGDIYTHYGDYKEALQMYDESIKLNQERNHEYGIISNLLGKALVHSRLRQINLGKSELNEALQIARKLKVSQKLLEVHEAFIKFYLNINDVDSVESHFERYTAVYDSIYSKQQFETLSEVQSKFTINQNLEKINRNLELQQQEERYLITTILFLLILVSAVLFKYRVNKKRNKELKQLNATKDKLFSIIAHDLRNPFFSLMGQIDLLKDKTLSTEDREQIITNLDQTTKKTYTLLENLLNLSASKRGKIEYSPTLLNLENIIAEIIDSLDPQLKNKSIIIETDLQQKVIKADKTMLEIVFRNLITNAIKFNKVGGKIIVTSVIKNNFVNIKVIDTGIGIDPKDQKIILSEDFVNSQVGTAGEKGTGLGLSLCKEFIQKHNGKLKINSELGKGSEFIITLPQIK
ncbi:MAG: tetratricopeptide repeat-containing sensor histidine kinase [Melioribacteraceae bacterium]|nr:tetratricopeptide repeat-containing sensor histidine kinase [Melioribacteraceae bacterium]